MTRDCRIDLNGTVLLAAEHDRLTLYTHIVFHESIENIVTFVNIFAFLRMSHQYLSKKSILVSAIAQPQPHLPVCSRRARCPK